MSTERTTLTREEIGRMGGKAAAAKGTIYVFTDEQRTRGARNAGLKVSQDRERMRELGRRGAAKRWKKEDENNNVEG